METHIWGYTIQYIGDDHSIMVNPTYTISQPVDQPVEKKPYGYESIPINT